MVGRLTARIVNSSGLVSILDYVGVATFAARAALGVARNGADVTATVLLALVAAVGGGTTRDILIGAPVFWFADPNYLFVCVGIGLVIWVFGTGRNHPLALDLFDAIGIGTYAVVGTLKAMLHHVGAPAAVVVGVIAATWGGLMREMLASEATILVRKDVYITASLIGAASLVVLLRCGLPETPAAWLSATGGALVRIGAIVLGLQMPEPRWRNGSSS